MTSESTRFLGQPNETKPTVGAVGWEDLLTVLLYAEAISAPASTEQQPTERMARYVPESLCFSRLNLNPSCNQNPLSIR